MRSGDWVRQLCSAVRAGLWISHGPCLGGAHGERALPVRVVVEPLRSHADGAVGPPQHLLIRNAHPVMHALALLARPIATA